MKDRISATEITVEGVDMSVRENVKSKKEPDTKHEENMGHYENIKPQNNRNRRRARTPNSKTQRMFSAIP